MLRLPRCYACSKNNINHRRAKPLKEGLQNPHCYRKHGVKAFICRLCEKILGHARTVPSFGTGTCGSCENCAELWYWHLRISSMRDHSKIILGLFGKSQYTPLLSLEGSEDECITGGSGYENFTSNSR